MGSLAYKKLYPVNADVQRQTMCTQCPACKLECCQNRCHCQLAVSMLCCCCAAAAAAMRCAGFAGALTMSACLGHGAPTCLNKHLGATSCQYLAASYRQEAATSPGRSRSDSGNTLSAKPWMLIAGTSQTKSDESVRKGKGSFSPNNGHWPVA